MKGIVLAGGTGSRLWPVTLGVSKQLLPVYDKPLIHYPISTLMLAGIRDILVITTPLDKPNFQRMLGDGNQFGINLSFCVQEKPDGIAKALVLGEDFINKDSVALILGDNIFHGTGLGAQLSKLKNISGALVFAYKVKDPQNYGVIELNKLGEPISIEEKPLVPKSRFVIPGLYFYDKNVVNFAKQIKPSARGELEITDVNREYLKLNKLKVSILPRGTAWLDTGSFASLNDASSFVRILEDRQNQKISCLEEIAWRNKWITNEQIMEAAENYRNSPFADYLRGLLN